MQRPGQHSVPLTFSPLMLFLHWMRTSSAAEDVLGRSTLKMLCPSTLDQGIRMLQSVEILEFHDLYRNEKDPRSVIWITYCPEADALPAVVAPEPLSAGELRSPFSIVVALLLLHNEGARDERGPRGPPTATATKLLFKLAFFMSSVDGVVIT